MMHICKLKNHRGMIIILVKFSYINKKKKKNVAICNSHNVIQKTKSFLVNNFFFLYLIQFLALGQNSNNTQQFGLYSTCSL